MTIAETVKEAIEEGKPAVALETAVMTHGLPAPGNVETLLAQVRAVRDLGAAPAVIGMLRGELTIGMSEEQIRALAAAKNSEKANLQNLATCAAKRLNAGVTVSATMHAAARAGIAVMATGGIGGVHILAPHDVSTDMFALSAIPMLVVCSGPKAVLDLELTLELLETHGVPVIGYGVDAVPGFYSVSCGVPVTARADTPEEAADIFRRHRLLGMSQAMLLAAPPPADTALPWAEVTEAVRKAVETVLEEGTIGRSVTPRLLAKVSERLGGRNLKTNEAVLVSNATIAARVAGAYARAR